MAKNSSDNQQYKDNQPPTNPANFNTTGRYGSANSPAYNYQHPNAISPGPAIAPPNAMPANPNPFPNSEGFSGGAGPQNSPITPNQPPPVVPSNPQTTNNNPQSLQNPNRGRWRYQRQQGQGSGQQSQPTQVPTGGQSGGGGNQGFNMNTLSPTGRLLMALLFGNSGGNKTNG